MRVKLELTDKYELGSQGNTIDIIFEDVLQDIHAEMNAKSNEELNVASVDDVTMASIIVAENDRDMNVSLRCEYGSQENGYLVEIEVTDSGHIEPDAAEKVYGDIIAILEEYANVRS